MRSACRWAGSLRSILGHAAAPIVKAIQQAATQGTSYGAPTELEVELALMIRDALPSMEMVRLVSSGTEAVMSAIRVARAFTKRAQAVVSAGRQPCPFCGNPMDPEGHLCPRANGFRRRSA